ncbi:anthranilate phosphoribosyltransferase [soil metagenome]
MRDLLLKLCNRCDLTREESRFAFSSIMSGEASEAQIGALLVGLASKGTTVDELVGAALVMREKATRIDVGCDPTSDVVLDTCGTGGDVRGTFNISTAAALIAAAAGVKVVKHGNRSASSKSGSADVLEALGVKLDVSADCLKQSLDEANICFAFARHHHPAMKFVSSARTSLGIPTIFNILGPLTNPGGARHQLLGVFTPELTERLAHVLRELGSVRAWVVHANDGLDELSTMSPTRVSELKDGQVSTWMVDPAELGLARANLSELQVDSADESAAMLRSIFGGTKSPARDIALPNAAAALVVAGKAKDLSSGLAIASDAVDSGKAQATLEALVRCTRSA